MKDEELKLEEIEATHTIGREEKCRCYSAVMHLSPLCLYTGLLMILATVSQVVCVSARGGKDWLRAVC